MLSKPIRLHVKSPFCGGTVICAAANHVIRALLELVFDQPQNGMN